jgi:hypothetical protein
MVMYLATFENWYKLREAKGGVPTALRDKKNQQNPVIIFSKLTN